MYANQAPSRSGQLLLARGHNDDVAEHEAQQISIAHHINQLCWRVTFEGLADEVHPAMHERMHHFGRLVQSATFVGQVGRVRLDRVQHVRYGRAHAWFLETTIGHWLGELAQPVILCTKQRPSRADGSFKVRSY